MAGSIAVREELSVQVRLLGPVDVVAHGHPQPVDGLRRKAVLACLALRSGEIVSTGRLVEAVWPAAAPPTALNTLQSHVSYLRKVLGSKTAIIARPPGYLLDLGDDPTDVRLAERLLRQGRQSADPGQGARDLRAALALWRGQPMAELVGLAWLEEQAERLDLLRAEVERALLGAQLAAGEHGFVVPDLERMADHHPLDEQVHGQLMLALYRNGRQADALAVYHRMRQRLGEELGIDPGQQLRDLEVAILRQDPALTMAAPAAVTTSRSATTKELASGDTLLAGGHPRTPDGPSPPVEPGARAPGPVAGAPAAPLTSFIGRVAEQAALAAALSAHRLVTAVGPGGVGKTRLALSVAAEVAGRYADGAWYVDLVPVTDPSMIAPAVAAVAGLSEHQGRCAEDIVLDWLASRQVLLVLDNCEHLLGGVAVLLERLLAGSPELTVLVTSRARLLVPFEWVFTVPGLSVAADGGEPGDAVELFLVRAAAGGSTLTPGDMERVAAICGELDGMALAIELTAARVASLRLDGIEAGLSDQLRLLAGGQRADDRHRSLRSALDWSYALLDEAGQAVLRRICVFAVPFTASAAAAVAGSWPPVQGAISAVLAGLADQSLLRPVTTSAGTRYRALEIIRQYGAERLADAGELVQARSAHLTWCLDTATVLCPAADDDAGDWRPAFDQVADELRSALGWAVGQADHRQEAFRLAMSLAELCFARGMPGESQVRYEQAAELTTGLATAAALHHAAGAAEVRHFGTEALRLRRAAADTAVHAGDRAAAAMDLARAAELINRGPGLMARAADADEVATLLAEATRLAAGDPAAQARTLTAMAFSHDAADPAAVDLIERAMTLARQARDPLTESAALDHVTSFHLAQGQLHAAAASAVRRTELLAPLRATAAAGMEFYDAFSMAAECAMAAGDLPAAREMAERAGSLPSHREEGHLATARLIVVAALAGDWDEALVLADRFREGWERAGRPRAGNLNRGAYAAATVHGLRGDDAARARWLEIVEALTTPGRPLSQIHVGEFFDAWLLLHQGHPQRALRLLHTPPEEFRAWYSGLWRPWYAALWAEAAVLTGHEDAVGRIRRARQMMTENPIAAAIVDRAAALAGDGTALAAAADALAAAGCRYQWARTLIFIGEAQRARGESVLAEMGATPMAWPGRP
jgi:predicted ATPase/DNA-binding SARP family transcriptional activator